MTAYHQVFD